MKVKFLIKYSQKEEFINWIEFTHQMAWLYNVHSNSNHIMFINVTLSSNGLIVYKVHSNSYLIMFINVTLPLDTFLLASMSPHRSRRLCWRRHYLSSPPSCRCCPGRRLTYLPSWRPSAFSGLQRMSGWRCKCNPSHRRLIPVPVEWQPWSLPQI